MTRVARATRRAGAPEPLPPDTAGSSGAQDEGGGTGTGGRLPGRAQLPAPARPTPPPGPNGRGRRPAHPRRRGAPPSRRGSIREQSSPVALGSRPRAVDEKGVARTFGERRPGRPPPQTGQVTDLDPGRLEGRGPPPARPASGCPRRSRTPPRSPDPRPTPRRRRRRRRPAAATAPRHRHRGGRPAWSCAESTAGW